MAVAIHVEGASKATLLSDDIRDRRRGRNWRSIKIPESKHSLAGLAIWKDLAHQLWVLTSANSREVVATRLVRMDKNGRWAITELPDWYLSDVKHLSVTHMVACGFTGKKLQRPIEDSEGIVAFSSDRGQSWKIIYRTKETPSINRLAVIGPNHLLALGDNGWIFKIHKDSQ